MTGGQEVAGSNPASPTRTSQVSGLTWQDKAAAVTPTTASLAKLTAQFQADENAANAVVKQVGTTVDNLGSNPSASDVASAVAPLITAAQRYETQVTDLPWPANMTSDAHTLVVTVGLFVVILQSVASQNVFSQAAWVSEFTSAEGGEHTAANTLRHDLGLPPES